MNYIKLTENNDWEGETWYFFLQQEGNEEAIAYLQDELSDDELSWQYEINTNPIPENEVDVLVKHFGGDTSGYMPLVTKFKGYVDLARLKKYVQDGEDEKDWGQNLLQALNKGGLSDYIKE